MGACCALATVHSPAQGISDRPMRMVVAVTAGGTTDIMGRLVATKLTERLGKRVIVENRPGPSQMIGADIVAKSAPDGHTLIMASSGIATINHLYSNVPFDAIKDFAPIAFIATSPYIVVVHPSLPVNNIRELIDHSKANPGKLSYSGGSPGTSQHLGGELLKRMTGMDMLYIMYKGTAAVMPDIIGGRLQVALENIVVTVPHIQRGALRGLGVTSLKRSSVIPEMPTVAEAGVPGYQVIGWFGVFAAARTPQPIVQKLNAEIAAIMKLPDVAERLVTSGAEPVSGPPNELRDLLARESAVWGKLIRESGLRIQ
jgi:tripartite-type tricarboxylate transporter receptor subunit TctC